MLLIPRYGAVLANCRKVLSMSIDDIFKRAAERNRIISIACERPETAQEREARHAKAAAEFDAAQLSDQIEETDETDEHWNVNDDE
jgi:uncharacterized radical SAM superfamily protein